MYSNFKFIVMKIKFAAVFLFTCYAGNAQQSLSVNSHKTRFPVGIFTNENTSIYGVAVGLGSDLQPGFKESHNTSNGIRLEPFSDAFLIFTLFFGPDEIDFPTSESEFADFESKYPNEIVNGINISSGTNAFLNINGITLSAISQSVKQSNGISIAGLGSSSFRNNGIQVAGAGTTTVFSNGLIASSLSTKVHTGKGLQIGGFNQYKNFSGLQVGFFNDVETDSENFEGVQVGVFNSTRKLKGIQLGLWNINEKRSLPLVNWNFKS